MTIFHSQKDPSFSLNLYRLLLAASGIAYLSWWVSVELLLPGSYNPLAGRLGVVSCCWILSAGSFYSSLISRHIAKAFMACLFLITIHYFYLFHKNHVDINWIVGSYITIIAAYSCLQTELQFISYSICVLLLSTILTFVDRTLVSTVFLPGMVTILLFGFIGLRARLRLVETQNQQNLKLKHLNEELEAFSFSVSHDLRAPLRTITGFSKIILADHYADLNEDVRSLFDKIIKGGDKMTALIESLLYMSKISRQEIRRREIDLSQLCNKIAETLKEESPHRRVKFNIEKNLTASGDLTLIEAALHNLLNNAWKYTSKKTETNIEFGMREIDGKRAFFVSDNGAGFDMKYAQNLFGVFQRFHSEAVFPGTGVGLATVKRIIQKHGGRIWAEARLDEGATFYFTL